MVCLDRQLETLQTHARRDLHRFAVCVWTRETGASLSGFLGRRGGSLCSSLELRQPGSSAEALLRHRGTWGYAAPHPVPFQGLCRELYRQKVNSAGVLCPQTCQEVVQETKHKVDACTEAIKDLQRVSVSKSSTLAFYACKYICAEGGVCLYVPG